MERISWRRCLAVVVVGLLVGAVAAPAPALAHGTLVFSTPADGGTVREPVDAVTLTFTEKPAPFAYFTVTAPGGVRVESGWSGGEPKPLAEPVREYQQVNGSWQPQLYKIGFPVNVAVSHWPVAGAYVAAYHTVASDGDVVKGEVRFTYGGPAEPAPPGWQAPADQPKPELLAAQAQAQGPGVPPAEQAAPAPAAADDTTMWKWLTPVLLIVAVVLGVLLFAPQLIRRRRG
jgi:methionine-rich copper-binding protein CopC